MEIVIARKITTEKIVLQVALAVLAMVAMKIQVYALIIIVLVNILIRECVIELVEKNVEEKENVIYSLVNALTAKKINGGLIVELTVRPNVKMMGELIVVMLKKIRMKEELESMGLVVAYKVFELPSFDVVIAIWEDKNEIPPLYVEVTVSEREG